MNEDMDMYTVDAGQSTFMPAMIGLHDLNTKEAALAAYDEAIQLAPQESLFYYHKAHVLEQLGRLAEAQRSYDEARRRECKE